MQTFTDSVRDNELQQLLRITRHQNSADSLVHALKFEATMSASCWANHKVRVLEDHDGTDDEEEEKRTETRRTVP